METKQPTSFGLVDGTPVFMDVAADSYFRLESQEECAFLRALRERERRSSEPILTGFLRGSGLKDWKIEPISGQPLPTSALPRRAGKPKTFEVLAVARLLLSVRRALRRYSIGDILEHLVLLPCGTEASAPQPTANASTFRNARNFVPLGGNCLRDSLALMHWLAKRGESATLVFGVKLDPFAAHCWVQKDEIALNDRPERIERFTPIRIIQCAFDTQ